MGKLQEDNQHSRKDFLMDTSTLLDPLDKKAARKFIARRLGFQTISIPSLYVGRFGFGDYEADLCYITPDNHLNEVDIITSLSELEKDCRQQVVVQLRKCFFINGLLRRKQHHDGHPFHQGNDAERLAKRFVHLQGLWQLPWQRNPVRLRLQLKCGQESSHFSQERNGRNGSHLEY